MDTPGTRSEFEERLNILCEQLRGGRLVLPRDPRLMQSLLRLRYLPNGRLDFLSVDELVRLQANTAYNMQKGNFSNMFNTLQRDDGGE
ncbi:MAG: AVAST type 1 anti-phage system protein Avs1c [Agitococcus sp.]|nr:AVAST type 1 anti-phage system protein Avs1c [Agitococcus sp.]